MHINDSYSPNSLDNCIFSDHTTPSASNETSMDIIIPDITDIKEVLQTKWPKITNIEIQKLISQKPKTLGSALKIVFPALGNAISQIPQLNVDIDITKSIPELKRVIKTKSYSLQSITIILLKSVSVRKIKTELEAIKIVIRILQIYTTIGQSDKRFSALLSQIESSKNIFNVSYFVNTLHQYIQCNFFVFVNSCIHYRQKQQNSNQTK